MRPMESAGDNTSAGVEGKFCLRGVRSRGMWPSAHVLSASEASSVLSRASASFSLSSSSSGQSSSAETFVWRPLASFTHGLAGSMSASDSSSAFFTSSCSVHRQQQPHAAVRSSGHSSDSMYHTVYDCICTRLNTLTQQSYETMN